MQRYRVDIARCVDVIDHWSDLHGAWHGVETVAWTEVGWSGRAAVKCVCALACMGRVGRRDRVAY